MAQTFDVCIRGSGIVGRTLALLLAQDRNRLRVALVGPHETPPGEPREDVRAYALNGASRALLQSLRAWPEAHHATAVQRMEVAGDQDGRVYFDAASQRVEALAWIVDVPALEARLAEAVRYQPQVELVHAPVPAPLTAICEGRTSSTRAEFGVEFNVTPYAQHAIAARLRCAQAHGQVAFQWFTDDASILAFLPQGGPQGNCVAMVWSVPQEQVAPLLALSPEEFAQRVQQASAQPLGAMELISQRSAWPLQQAQAQHWCGAIDPYCSDHTWVLAGDAAHNVHPLAGQGLNLGLADVQALARILQERPGWRSVCDMRLLRRYERERKAQLLPMGLAMDGLQQLFSRREAGVQTLRNWGLKGVQQSHLLKHWLARQAMGQN